MTCRMAQILFFLLNPDGTNTIRVFALKLLKNQLLKAERRFGKHFLHLFFLDEWKTLFTLILVFVQHQLRSY